MEEVAAMGGPAVMLGGGVIRRPAGGNGGGGSGGPATRATSSSSGSPGAVTSARAECPHCGAHNEFDAGSLGASTGTLRCGQCSTTFQVQVPADSAGTRGGASLRICRRCGTVNQFPLPAPGAPLPDVQCGNCGHITPAPQNAGRPRRVREDLLIDPRTGVPRAGPMVRVNVGGQRRTVPLAYLLALMSEEQGNPANRADIADLPTRKVKADENLGEQKRCQICLEDFGDGDDVKTLPCLHIYHQKCIERWLNTDNSCPVCKTPIGQ